MTSVCQQSRAGGLPGAVEGKPWEPTRSFGSLFAGIGGLDLGLERAGWVCQWQAETDDYATKVLERHWPDVTRFGDVRECGNDNLEPVDLVCGGFPCTDVSVAGRRAGLAGEQSGLWWEFHRIIAELAPRWLVIENVPGLLSSGSRRDMGTIIGALGKLGYMGAYRVLDAQYFGVAQRRRRVFIIGHLGDGRAAEVLFERASRAWNPAPSREKKQETAATLTRGSARGRGVNPPGRRREDDVNLVARPLAFSKTTDHYDTSQQTYVAYGVSENQRAEVRLTPYSRQITTGGGKPGQGYPCVAFANVSDGSSVRSAINLAPPLTNRHGDPGSVASLLGVRRLTPMECERLQGFPDDWTAGQSDSARYRQLGNAVCVPVAEWIGRRILAAEGQRRRGRKIIEADEGRNDDTCDY